MQTGSEKLKKTSVLDKWLNREKKEDLSRKIKPHPEGVSIPLSPGQKRLFFLQQLYPENPFYNYADAYRFKGKLNIDQLIESFEIVFRRHDILRTRFRLENNQVVQRIDENPRFEVFRHDLRKVSSANNLDKAEQIAIRESNRSFKLDEGPLTRISILQLSDEDCLMILTMHHIIFDKWSMEILLSELAGTYHSLSTGKQNILPPLDIQYADFAYWQNEQKTDPEILSYWMEKLADSEGFLDLPTDFQRPHHPTFRGAYSTKTFPKNLSEKIKEICRQTDTTPYVFLLTAYKILLSFYTRHTDILVGSPFTNRDRVDLEKLIGFFNDTLVLRSDLSPGQTFIELLKQVQQTTRDAFAHKNMPFETLVRSLKPERYVNYNPLFQVMFIYHQVSKMPSFGENLKVSHEPFDFGVAKFDLTLYVSDEDDRLKATFEYAKDLFDEKTIEHMHRHLNNLLKGILENPNTRISELPFITDEESELISEWNNTGIEHAEATSVVRLFAEQVKLNPEKKAVSFNGTYLTYRELNERANRVANYLNELDLDKDEPVGLFIERSINMVVGIFGILKAGLAYLPLDAEYPPERIKYALEDSEASVVLTEAGLFDLIDGEFSHIQLLEKILSSSLATEPELKREVKKEDLAYVIYTSGSTGKPKGVSVTHENLFYSTMARFEYYKNEPKNFLLLSSFSFDSSVAGIFWTLTTGGNLVVSKRRIEQDLEGLAEFIADEKITHTLILPSLYSLLLDDISKERLTSFDTVIVAGEVCSPTVCRKHFETLPEVKLYNEYGPTEATVWATAHRITPEDVKKELTPIGKPIANTQIHILDENQNLVPIRVSGEIHISGKGVVAGYLNKSGSSPKVFIQNPFGSESDLNKLYRTGDLGRYRSDGTIEFLGRKDNQVKIRGFRIEPGEIQETIKAHPKVKDVIVKPESFQNSSAENERLPNDFLTASLRKLKVEEATEILESVEKLAEREVAFILSEMESE